MTPTLAGRWQTRLLLLGTAGLAITLLFAMWVHDLSTPVTVLVLVLVLGFGWDVLYQFCQRFRWDGDWPPWAQAIAGLWEGFAAFRVAMFTGVLESSDLGMMAFVVHYGAVWLTTFLIAQGPLKIFLPRWRYRGGEWL